MYRNSQLDKDRFVRNMEALKRENQAYKALLSSKKYKIGQYVSEVKGAFRSVKDFSSYCNTVKGKFRWRKLCRKYPITHVKDVSSKKILDYFSDEEIIVYTCIFGNYDLPQEPVFVPNNCKFIIFTDQKISSNSVWKKAEIPAELFNKQFSNAEKNRFCKMMPHLLFPNHRYSIYLDGNIKPVTDLTEFVNLCTEFGMALHIHKARNCVYDEIEACRILRKSPDDALCKFAEFLEKKGFPHNYGMNECNVIVRDHTNTEVQSIMSEWWEMFKNGSVKRDQLSFPFLLYMHGIKPSFIGTLGNNVQENPAIRVTQHDSVPNSV